MQKSQFAKITELFNNKEGAKNFILNQEKILGSKKRFPDHLL